MTITTLTTHTDAVGVPRTTCSSYLRTVWRKIKYRMHQYQSVRHLNNLSSASLKDLGIHRCEIRSVVYGRHGERVRIHDV